MIAGPRFVERVAVVGLGDGRQARALVNGALGIQLGSHVGAADQVHG